LVVRIRKFKSNTFQNDKEKDFLAREICAAGQILHGTNGAAGKTYLIKCAAGRIFGLSPDGYSVLLIYYVIIRFPQITAQNLLLLINGLIH